MIGKIFRAAIISVGATLAAVLLLRRSESRRAAGRPGGGQLEIDSDRLDSEERDALVAELDAQL
ncbi:MAG: hypothetical protein ACI84D_003358 [Thalassolituus oleivorans]|jgi:hypothetical protein